MLTKIKTILQILYRKPQYFEDGMISIHVCHFRDDPRYAKAKQVSLEKTGAGVNIDWRLHTVLWAADRCSKLDGDFLECGVDTGFYMRACVEYLDWNKLGKKMMLIDTYEGIPVELLTDKEKMISPHIKKGYKGTYESVKKAFKDIDNIHMIQGKIPLCLDQVKSEKVAFMSIDMNSVVAEMAAIEYFWEKIVPGGIIILDDYSYSVVYSAQRIAWNEWAQKQGVSILTLGTGQGLIIK